MRLFVAVELPVSAQSNLRVVQQRLDAHLRAAALQQTLRWTAPENIHLTLRFLGETSAAQRVSIESGLARVAQDFEPHLVEIVGLGAFPSFRRPSVLWAGLRGTLQAMAMLTAMQAACEQVARDAAFPAEDRPFSPHLTLARFRREAPAAALGQAGALLRPLTSGPAADTTLADLRDPLPVEQLVLMHSDLRPEGAIYSPLATFRLTASSESAR